MACSGGFPVRISSFSDEVLLSSDKSDPYISKKHVGNIVSLNCVVSVHNERLGCSQLSALYVYKNFKCHSSDKKFKVYDLFRDEGSIRRAAVAISGIHRLHGHMLNRSSDRRIIVCDRFGCFLHEIATNIGVNSQRLFLLCSCNHVMSLRVTCKLKTNYLGNAECRYVVHVFDPNKTNVTARSEVSDPDCFLDQEKFSLRKFIGSHSYDEYFKELPDAPEEHELMVYECSDIEGSRCLSRSGVGVGECLSRLETLSYDGISECALYHLMESGLCSKNIIMMSGKLSLLPSNVRENVVFGRSSSGTSALNAALSNDNHNSVRAYCHLLDSLSENEKLKLLPLLLIGGNKNGESGLVVAMQEDNTNSINAFADLLDMLLSLRLRIPASRLANMISELLTYGASGSGLFVAMQGGCSLAIAAFGNLLDRLIDLSYEVPASEISEIIFTILKSDNKGVNGLFIAMKRGESFAIDSFGKLLDRLISLSDEVPALDIARMIFTILMSVNDRGITGLCVAMQKGRASSICSFGKLLERLVSVGSMISGHHLEKMVFDILLASSGSGDHGLFEALKNNYVDSIREYCSLLGLINQSRWPYLLAAKNVRGITGILFANEETISFYLSMLKEFTI
ncbi:ShET2/EspL2 family type III secretion system effector toxin, partial [Candidatus Ichthyocystis hellenicum]|uniref:ShET2/EspL2 family type III secretion system effector toxin n=1 Tax=Candidatus Ichthyocystis hellenicum TaxID=1561003 RepID=UPI000B84C36C